MGFSIVFDYRFDTDRFYDDPEVRLVMERAAEIWSGFIQDAFEDVAAGTSFTISNPSVSGQTETITLTEDIDDLLIFAGSRELNSLGLAGFAGTNAKGDIFKSRVSNDFRDTGAVTDFEPWAGTLVLDQRVDWGLDLEAPEAGKIDLLSIVLHEIGHVLGIGTAPAYKALAVDHTFTGVNTLAVNGGVAVPLDQYDSHVEEGFHDNDVLLDPISETGTRKLPGELELAMLADIGYEVEGYITQGSTPELTTQEGETVFGTILGDYIHGLGGDDHLQGDTGDDTLFGGGGDDVVFGQEGNDFLEGGDGNDFLLGGAGNDILRAGAGDDSLRTGDGADRIILENGMGSDTVYDFEFGLDVLDLGTLDETARAGITVSENSAFQHVSLADGGEIYLLGSVTDRVPSVALTGEAEQGATLTATFRGITDIFGAPAADISYSWLRDGVQIDGATDSSYVLDQKDVGATINASAEYTTDGAMYRVSSATTASVGNINDLPEGEISLAGTLVVGAEITALTTLLEDEDGLGELSFQWMRDSVPIEGATGASYRVVSEDADSALTVVVQYIDGQGTTETLSSSPATTPVEAIAEEPVLDLEPEVEVDPVHLVTSETPLSLTGSAQDDRLVGADLDDVIYGGLGNDTLVGGSGDDLLVGGEDVDDLRDLIFGGAGNDTIDGGYGNDELRGDSGNDVIAGGFGADLVIGGEGNDMLTGSALGDRLFGGDGDDFLNGGFGFDQLNGGDGADTFYHLGTENHGSDWIQDYLGSQGDTLAFGNAAATAAQFQINTALTQGAGEADVAEAFVIYKPTGQILWALVDGANQDEINLTLGGTTFDLLG